MFTPPKSTGRVASTGTAPSKSTHSVLNTGIAPPKFTHSVLNTGIALPESTHSVLSTGIAPPKSPEGGLLRNFFIIEIYYWIMHSILNIDNIKSFLYKSPFGGFRGRNVDVRDNVSLAKRKKTFYWNMSIVFRKCNKNSGHTMIELLLAIVVTAMVSTVIFTTYLGIQKQFGKNQSNANVVFQMINTKNKLKKIFNEVYEVEEIYSNKIYYKTIEGNEQNNISFLNGAVKHNGKNVINSVEKFEIEISSEKENEAVLIYSVQTMKHSWLGGTKKIFIK